MHARARTTGVALIVSVACHLASCGYFLYNPYTPVGQRRATKLHMAFLTILHKEVSDGRRSVSISQAQPGRQELQRRKLLAGLVWHSGCQPGAVLAAGDLNGKAKQIVKSPQPSALNFDVKFDPAGIVGALTPQIPPEFFSDIGSAGRVTYKTNNGFYGLFSSQKVIRSSGGVAMLEELRLLVKQFAEVSPKLASGALLICEIVNAFGASDGGLFNENIPTAEVNDIETEMKRISKEITSIPESLTLGLQRFNKSRNALLAEAKRDNIVGLDIFDSVEDTFCRAEVIRPLLDCDRRERTFRRRVRRLVKNELSPLISDISTRATQCLRRVEKLFERLFEVDTRLWQSTLSVTDREIQAGRQQQDAKLRNTVLVVAQLAFTAAEFSASLFNPFFAAVVVLQAYEVHEFNSKEDQANETIQKAAIFSRRAISVQRDRVQKLRDSLVQAEDDLKRERQIIVATSRSWKSLQESIAGEDGFLSSGSAGTQSSDEYMDLKYYVQHWEPVQS